MSDSLPNNDVVRRHIFGLAVLCFAVYTCRVERCGYTKDDVGCRKLVAKVCLHSDSIRNLCGANFRDRGYDAQWELHVGS